MKQKAAKLYANITLYIHNIYAIIIVIKTEKYALLSLHYNIEKVILIHKKKKKKNQQSCNDNYKSKVSLVVLFCYIILEDMD